MDPLSATNGGSLSSIDGLSWTLVLGEMLTCCTKSYGHLWACSTNTLKKGHQIFSGTCNLLEPERAGIWKVQLPCGRDQTHCPSCVLLTLYIGSSLATRETQLLFTSRSERSQSEWNMWALPKMKHLLCCRTWGSTLHVKLPPELKVEGKKKREKSYVICLKLSSTQKLTHRWEKQDEKLYFNFSI